MKTPAKQKKVETVTAELVELMRALKPDADDSDLQNHAHALQVISTFAARNNLPEAQELGGAKEDLKDIARLVGLLIRKLQRLSLEGHRAFENVKPDGVLPPCLLLDELVPFKKAADRALEDVPDDPREKGRRNDVHAKIVTDHAAKIFENLTGEAFSRRVDPNNSGRPHDFLSEVLRILEVGASADSQLKLYSARRAGNNTPS